MGDRPDLRTRVEKYLMSQEAKSLGGFDKRAEQALRGALPEVQATVVTRTHVAATSVLLYII